MSMRPATLKTGPATTNMLIRKRYIIIYFFIIWLDALIPIWMIWSHVSNVNYVTADKMELTRFFLTLPFHAILWYFTWILGAVVISKIFLVIVNLIHKPREGYFPRDPKNKDYKYWNIRAVIKKYPIYIIHNFPLPWMDIIVFKMFGVKTSMKVSLFDAWVDTEFIEIGENTIIGQGSLIMSTMLTRDFLIIKKIKIGKNCVIGGYSVLSPGTIVNDNVTLGTHSATTIEQELESNWVYLGVPARKYKRNEYKSMQESDEEIERTSKIYVKQFLTIDDIEEIELKKSLSKKNRLRYLKEKEAELMSLLEGETDEIQIRRTERALAKLREKIKEAEERKTISEKLKLTSTNLDKLERKAKKLEDKIKTETDEEQKRSLEEKLEEIKSRIESEKLRREKSK
ncbi:MAG: hypothetical protein ACTSU2_14980 [Promethearchaeota archaeon]